MTNKDFEFQIQCNILLIGKSGAGKSSFANYLFGVDHFTTGTGKPVTDWEQNFQKNSFFQDEVLINVYDSVGLEQTNFEQWSKRLSLFLEKQKRDKDEYDEVPLEYLNSITHVLFYVINAASARVEIREIGLVREIYEQYGTMSAFVLTNCDNASEKQIQSIKEEIKKESKNIPIIEVCSISKKTRSGDQVNAFGREEATKILLKGSFEKIGKDLAIKMCEYNIDRSFQIEENICDQLDRQDISFFKAILDSDKFEDSLNSFNSSSVFFGEPFTCEIPDSFKNYNNFLMSFPVQWRGKTFLQNSYDKLNSLLNDMEEPELIEGEGVLKVIGTVFSCVFSLKKFMKKRVGEIFDSYRSQIRTVIRDLERFESL